MERIYDVTNERKSFVFISKENPRGQFLRIRETRAGKSVPVIIPATGLKEFQAVLADRVKVADENRVDVIFGIGQPLSYRVGQDVKMNDEIQMRNDPRPNFCVRVKVPAVRRTALRGGTHGRATTLRLYDGNWRKGQ